MKKSILCGVFVDMLMFFAGCKEHQTPETDTTKLYPAYSTSIEKWGFIDDKGNFVVTPIYSSVTNFSCGYALVYVSNNNEPIFIDKKGKVQNTPSIDDAEPFYYGYSRFALNNGIGFMSTSFETTCYPIFYDLGTMSINGLASAIVSSGDKVSYVNAKGETKIQAMFNRGYDFEDGIAVVAMGDRYGTINTNGDFVIQPTYEKLWPAGHGFVRFEQNGKYGLMDKKGNVAVQPVYESIGICLDNSLIPVQQNEKMGYVDKKGNVKMACVYDYCTSFFEGYALVYRNERQQIIDTDFNTVLILAEGEQVVNYHNGLALVKRTSENETHYKYINKDNAIIYAWSFHTGWYSPAQIQGADRENSFVEMSRNFDSRKL